MAAARPGTGAVVVVEDIRQTLSWLCGRTQQPTTCTIADGAADMALGVARTGNNSIHSTAHDTGPL